MIKWIKNKIKSIFAAVLILGAAVTAPVIPVGDGLISVSIFEDIETSERIYVQIPDSQYNDMGKKGGYSQNPTKEGYKLITSYQYPKEKYREQREIITATSTHFTKNPQPKFNDRDDLVNVFKFFTPEVEAAIAFDNAGGGSLVDAVTQTTAFNAGSGSSRLLWVGSVVRGQTTSGVTYNAVSMTELTSNFTIGGSSDKVQLWYLAAPASGSNNVVITADSSTLINGGFSSYTGAAQTGIPDAETSNTVSTENTLSTTVTTVADNSWAMLVARANSDDNANAGSGTTERGGSSGGLDLQMFDGNALVTPAANTTLVVNGITQNYGVIMASFAPFTGTVAGEEVSNSWGNTIGD